MLFIVKVVPKSKHVKDMLLTVISTNILFSSYAAEEQNAIVDAFESRNVAEDVFVIKQGEQGDFFYVVESGTLDIFIKGKDGENNKVGSTLTAGASFGELALMYGTPRAASIKAKSPCVLWEIDRTAYRGILVYYKFLRNKEYMGFLRNVEIMEKKLGTIMTESKSYITSFVSFTFRL
jgi:CRP-like cAMP-binding protein